MSEQEFIKTVEGRTKKEIERMLRKYGLGKGYKAGDYSLAKKIVFMGRWIDSDIYDKQIKWICDYLGV